MPRATESDLPYIFNRLREAKEIVYDAETTGLDWKRCVICGHVVTFSPKPDDSWYIPVRHEKGNNFDPNKVEPTIVKLLNNQSLTIIGHNLAFDLKFLSQIGHDLSAKYQDSIINAPLLNEWQPKFSLAYCAQVAGVQAKKSEEIENHIRSLFPDLKGAPMGSFWRLSANDPMATEYAAGDGTTTWQLRDWQLKELAKQELLKVWDIENRLIPILARMSVKGIKIDEEYLNKLQIHTENKVYQLLEACPEGFNPKSPLDMEKYCRDAGVTNWPTTPTGRPSFAENWLESFEAGQKIVELRKLMTLLSMFIVPLKETHIFNGRVHADFNQLRGDGFGVITGRIASSSPGLGQVPKRDKRLGPIFRAAFIADEGKIFADPDYSQLEPRLLAYYSRSKVLLNDYRNNPDADAHQAVADAAGIERTWGKNANMTIINGGGRGVLISKYHVPADKVDQLLVDYFKTMPEIKKLQFSSANVMRSRGYIKSLLGRRSRVLDPSKAYMAINRLLQVGNADILKLKMVEIDEYLASEGRPIDILNTVHDALLMQFTVENTHHYKKCLDIMIKCGEGDVINLDVPLKVNTAEGEDWSIATYGDEVRPLIDEIKNFNGARLEGIDWKQLAA